MTTTMNSILDIPIGDIFADANFNCRNNLAPIDVHDLASSIKTEGQLQPAIVRSRRPDEHIKEKYVLLAGFRRRFACIVAGVPTLRCILKEVASDKEALLVNLLENLNRADLNIVEEGNALRRMVAAGWGQKEIAEKIGKSTTYVNTRVRLCGLPEDIKKEAAEGNLTAYHINKIMQLPTGSDAQYDAVRKIKDQIQRGLNKTDIIIKKKGENLREQKKRRNHLEIGRMKMFLLSNGLEGIQTQLLAWCEGNLTNEQIFTALKVFGESEGKNITIPIGYDLTN